MPFSALSIDLVLLLMEQLKDRDVSVLSRSCRAFHRFLNPYLYARDAKRKLPAALVWAVSHTNLATARLALEAGAGANKTLYESDTATREVWVNWGPPLTEVVQRWLSRGVPENPHLESGVRDRTAIIRLLLESGAKLQGYGNDTISLLGLAGRHQVPELIHLLDDYVAIADAKTSRDAGLITAEAARGGSVEVLQMLLDRGFPADCASCFPLHLAAGAGNLDTARLLLQRGADVNARDQNGCTPLQAMLHILGPKRGMKELRLAMARLLVEHGSDLNNSDITKDSLLLTAMQYPDDAMISYLINSGVNVHWKQANGATLLHRIAIGNYPASCISKVAGLGVDLEARDNSGYTALHYAVLWAPNIKILRAMVQLPVNLDARNDKGENALHLASETKRSTVTPNLGLHCTYSSQRVRLLVEAGADINARCLSDGATPLHYATGSGATGRVRTLLDLGADTKVKDNAGLTILDTVRKLDLILCPERARIEKLLLDKEGKTRSQPVRRRAEDTNTRITRSVKRARTAKVTRASARAPK